MTNRPAVVLLSLIVSICVKLTFAKEFYIEKQNVVSWFQAHVECVSKNYNGLAVASTAEEERELLQYIEREAPGELYFWIGLTSLGQHSRYVWFPTGQEAQYLHWARGEPKARENEDCVAVMKVEGQWGWNDDDCYQPKAKFVCEK